MPLIDQPDTPELQAFTSAISGGAIDLVEPHLLPPSAAAYLLNCPIDKDGIRQKRPGVGPRGPNFDSSALAPRGLYTLDNGQYRKLILRAGNNIYSNSDQDIFWTRYACSISFCDLPYHGAQGRGANGVGSTRDLLYLTGCVSMDATTNTYCDMAFYMVDDTATITAAPTIISLRYSLFYQRRGWGIDDHTLYWTAIDRMDLLGYVIGAGQGSIKIGSTGFDINTSIHATRQDKPQLLIFRTNSVWLLDIYWTTDGYYSITAGISTMDFTGGALLRPILQETGCIASRAVTWIPGGQGGDFLFLSREGIRSLRRSITDAQQGASIPLSQRIQHIIDRINWDRADRATAAYHEGIAYFSFPIDNATENNFTAAYDLSQDGWWFLDWQVAAWTRIKWPGKKHLLYFQSNVLGTETYANVGRNGYHIYNTETGTNDPFRQPVRYYEETRGFSFDVDGQAGSGLRNRKRWNWLEMVLESPGTNCTIAVGYRLDDASTFTNLGYVSISGAETGNLYRRMDLNRLRPAYSLQFSFEDTQGYGRWTMKSYDVRAYPLNPNFS